MTTSKFDSWKQNYTSRKITTPYIIAEAGVNHECSIDNALRMVEEASTAGADSIKFQHYKSEELVTKKAKAYWDTTEEPTQTQYELFKKYDHFNKEDYLKLHKACQINNIDFSLSTFSPEACIATQKLVPFIKIASADITNYPLLRAAASTTKTIIMSTGASNQGEIEQAIKYLQESGCKSSDIILLHCVLSYPTPINEANLIRVKTLSKVFPDHLIGYSDHTVYKEKNNACVAAYCAGAAVIEKHYSYDKTLPGNDHYHSMDTNDLKLLVKDIKECSLLLGNDISVDSLLSGLESQAVQSARRRIVASKSILKGEIFSNENLTTKRGTIDGLEAKYWLNLLGKKSMIDYNLDDEISKSELKL